jgi:energy-converting hydrogenase A subunit M
MNNILNESLAIRDVFLKIAESIDIDYQTKFIQIISSTVFSRLSIGDEQIACIVKELY